MGPALTFPRRRTTCSPFPGNPKPPPAPPGPEECHDSGKPSERPLWPGGTCTALGAPPDAGPRLVPGSRAPKPGAHSALRRQQRQSSLQWYPAVQAQRRGAVRLPGSTATRALPAGEKEGSEAAGARADTHLPPRATRSPAPPAPNHPDPPGRSARMNHSGHWDSGTPKFPLTLPVLALKHPRRFCWVFFSLSLNN